MKNQEAPESCRGCHKPFRPRGAKVADYPGTLAYHGKGCCSNCRRYERGRDGEQPAARPSTEDNRRSLDAWLNSHWCPANRVKVVKL